MFHIWVTDQAHRGHTQVTDGSQRGLLLGKFMSNRLVTYGLLHASQGYVTYGL